MTRTTASWMARIPTWRRGSRGLSWRRRSRSTGQCSRPSPRSGTSSTAGSRSLATRGAPLKAGARAMTLLGGHGSAWPLVEGCLEAALTALALYDDASDWELDLEAGRWNAFVAAAGVADQRPASRVANRTRVLLALLNDGAATRGYGLVSAEAGRAAAM